MLPDFYPMAADNADEEEWMLYIKPRCPWCVEAVAYLREAGYAFTPINVLSDPDAYARMRKLSGQSYTPTLVIGDLLLADFDTDELEEFIEENDLKPQA
jgi:glutaredoxin